MPKSLYRSLLDCFTRHSIRASVSREAIAVRYMEMHLVPMKDHLTNNECGAGHFQEAHVAHTRPSYDSITSFVSWEVDKPGPCTMGYYQTFFAFHCIEDLNSTWSAPMCTTIVL